MHAEGSDVNVCCLHLLVLADPMLIVDVLRVLQKSLDVGRKLKASTDIAVDPNTVVSKSVGAATANAGVSGLPTVTVSTTDYTASPDTPMSRITGERYSISQRDTSLVAEIDDMIYFVAASFICGTQAQRFHRHHC